MSLDEGAQFAGFTVARLLGVGGMGEVYLVRPPRLPRYEALKVLRADVSADAGYRQRFERESELAAGLWHPHIVGLHDRGEFEGQLWISMDYVDGPDARALLEQHYPAGMPAGDVVAIVVAVASALDHAHARGLLHRDVKPANIMLSRPDASGTPRILLSDFGIARAVDDISGLTLTNMSVGTIGYSAPEQLMGAPSDGRADQYALAASAYHLLTGVKLFSHPNPVAVISAHLNAAPPLPGTARPELAGVDAVFARALAKDPGARFERCSDFAAALAHQLHLCAAGSLLPTEITAVIPTARPQSATLTAPAPTAAAHPGPLAAAPAPHWAPHQPSPPAPAAARRRPRRTKQLAALTAAVTTAIAAVLALVIVVPQLTHDDPHPAPTADQQRASVALVGQQYLEALQRGDAAAALALGGTLPISTPWVSPAVLRAQLATTPVTDIAATPAPPSPGDNPAEVQYLVLSAKFGNTPSQARVSLHRKGNQWKLDTRTVPVDIGTPGAISSALQAAVAIWGIETHGTSPVAVFPGAVAISSTNRYVDITSATPPVLLDALTDTSIHPVVQPVATLNDTGRQAATAAINTWAHNCYRGVTPADGCLRINPYNDTLTVDGDGDFSKVSFDFDPARLTITVSGNVTYASHTTAGQPLTAVTLSTLGTIDLGNQPPIFIRTATAR